MLLVPDDTPTDMVNYVILTRYVDANIFHDQLTVSSVTGILHFANKYQFIGIIRSILLWRHPHILLGLFLDVTVCIRLLISVIYFDILVYPLLGKAKFL